MNNNMTDQRESNQVFQGPQANASLSSEQYQVPTDIVPLPSRGIVYPETSPLHKCEALEIRAMTAREEDILSSIALIKKGQMITQLLRSTLIDKRVNPNELLSGDRNALLIALRITGYGAEYPIESTCSSCDHKDRFDMDLSSLEIKFLEQQPDESGINAFSYVLPISKRVVKFRLITGIDEEQMMTEMAQKKKASKTQIDNLVTARLQRSIVSIDDKTDRLSIISGINNMPAGDSRKLRKYMSDIDPGIHMKTQHTCTACGDEQEVDVGLDTNFFWPDA
jgi:hypothetical protein